VIPDGVRARLRDELCDRADIDVSPAALGAFVRAAEPLLADADVTALAAALAADIAGLGPLDALLADPAVSEVMVNAGAVWVEREGALQKVSDQLDSGAVARVVERIVGPLGLRVDRAAPIVDARLPDGSRVCVVMPPVAVDGVCLAVRRFASSAVGLADFCSAAVVGLLREVVVDRYNVLVAGGASAGKTTLLNALAGEIEGGERIVTIEDAAELRLPQSHVVRLETRPANAEGAGAVGVRTLLRAALRLRPDRIIVGEVRDGAALDMLQALNTGHAGSFSTCHANSATDALRRVETMALMGDVDLSLTGVREQLAATVDIVVVVAKTGAGRRRVVEVAEVLEPGPAGWTVRPLATGAAVQTRPARPSRRGEAR
jgi:pilus assembly protein CpaF